MVIMITTNSTMIRPSADFPGFADRPAAFKRAEAAAPLSGLSNFALADRLAAIWARNAGRLERLEELRDRIDTTRRHLSSDAGRRDLGEAYLRRLIDKQQSCLDALRADRRRAAALVREIESRRACPPSPHFRRALSG